MNHSEIEELLGAYALDAVDPDEREVVERHLATCARCRAEVAEHREVASLLAHEGGQAPDGMWTRIAGALEAPPPDLRLAPAPAPAPAPPAANATSRAARAWWPSRTVLALVAAAAVVVVALLGNQVVGQGDRIDQLEAALDDPLAPALQEALEDPGSTVFELESVDGAVALRGAVTADGVGYLRTSALPELGPGRTYQLWGGTGDEFVSLGVLGAGPGVVTFAGEGYEVLAVTDEASPGVVAPTADPVVAGSLA